MNDYYKNYYTFNDNFTDGCIICNMYNTILVLLFNEAII